MFIQMHAYPVLDHLAYSLVYAEQDEDGGRRWAILAQGIVPVGALDPSDGPDMAWLAAYHCCDALTAAGHRPHTEPPF